MMCEGSSVGRRGVYCRLCARRRPLLPTRSYTVLQAWVSLPSCIDVNICGLFGLPLFG